MNVSPQLNTLMLVDLGQKVLNAISATQVCGHTRLSHSAVYVHSDDLTVKLVEAILDGRIGPVSEALLEWQSAGAKALCARYGLDVSEHFLGEPDPHSAMRDALTRAWKPVFDQIEADKAERSP